MKTKFLKKVRKRYKWFWYSKRQKWFLLDNKKKSTISYDYSWEIVEHMITEFLGLGSASTYLSRVRKRRERVQYMKCTKIYEQKKY